MWKIFLIAALLYDMKTIKMAIWINIILYIILLCGSAWVLSQIFTAPKLQLVPSYPKYVFISFQFIGHIFLVLCIIGLALRQNWGRILAIILNFIMVIGIGANLFLNGNILKSNVYSLSPFSQHYLFSIIYLIIFASVTIVLSGQRAKQFFKR